MAPRPGLDSQRGEDGDNGSLRSQVRALGVASWRPGPQPVDVGGIGARGCGGVICHTRGVRTRGRGTGAGPATGPAAQANAPIDVTGNWVSIVNEDWRWRMVTPAKGDYASVPISDEGRKVADTWDPSKEGGGRGPGE